MLSESTESSLPDAIWHHVIALAHENRDHELMALWLMLPPLRRAYRRIFARCVADQQEIESAMVFGVLTKLRRLDASSTGVTAVLRNAAYSHGYKARKWIRRESPSEFIEYYVDQVQPQQQPSWDDIGAPVPTAPENNRREGVRLGAIIQRLELFRPRCSWTQPIDQPTRLRPTEDLT